MKTHACHLKQMLTLMSCNKIQTDRHSCHVIFLIYMGQDKHKN